MGFNLEKYIKGSAKDAFSRMSEDASNQLRDAAINSVTKTFGGALKKLGFSNKIVSSLTSKMADAAQAELAERFFKKANPEINRIPAANGEGVRQNRVKGSQETVDQFQQIIGKGYGASTLSYPTERGYYYCQLTFYNYSRPNAHDNGTLEPKSIIYLPLPAGETLSERQSLKLTNTDLGAGGAVGDMVAKNDVGTGGVIGAATPAVERVISKLGNAAIDGAGDATVNFLQQSFAYAPNPHTSVMFQGVNLRTHQFSWRLSPETPTESVQASEIARLLRFYSLPTFFTDTSALFSYPMICKVKFFAGDEEHPYLKNFTKYCMVEEVVINYAPNGVPSFFSGTDAPTSIQLGLQLREIEYFTAESYGTAKEMKELGRIRNAEEELTPAADAREAAEAEPSIPPPDAKAPEVVNKPLNRLITSDELGQLLLRLPKELDSSGFKIADGRSVRKNADGTTTILNIGISAVDTTSDNPKAPRYYRNTVFAQFTDFDAEGKPVVVRTISSRDYDPKTLEGRMAFESMLLQNNMVKIGLTPTE